MKKVIIKVFLGHLMLLWVVQNLSAQPPSITSFTPTSGVQSTQVFIAGSNFTGATAVSFGGTPAAFFIVTSSSTITAYVGSGSTGSVSVTTPSGMGSLAGFTYMGPAITSFSPTTGAQ